MQRLALTKPDGRALTLYARGPLDPAMTAPSPFAAPPSLLCWPWGPAPAHCGHRTFRAVRSVWSYPLRRGDLPTSLPGLWGRRWPSDSGSRW